MRKTVIGGLVAALLCGLSGLQAQDSAQKPAEEEMHGHLKIKVTSVFVVDQQKALEFYTEILGFVKKADVPVGEFRWLTVVSPEEPGGTELLLEPNDNPAAKRYQEDIFQQGIPATMFFVDDIHETYERLNKLGVKFVMEPTKAESVTIAVFDDTCGNLIQIAQE